MKHWILLFVVWVTLSVNAQPETHNIEIIDGKEYYVHLVQAGNTLWGIHKEYNVPVEDIIAANPGVDKGISEGQKIIIPVQSVTIMHTVLENETLFSISKKYNVTVERINTANPDLKNELKAGQTIYIPGVYDTKLEMISSGSPKNQSSDTLKKKPEYRVSLTDTIILHTLGPNETLYSVSKRYMVGVEELQQLNGLKNSKVKPGQTLKIPVLQEKIEVVSIRQVDDLQSEKLETAPDFPKKSSYKVVLMLPFHLEKGANYSEFLSTLAAEFYMGAKLAIDSLEALGLNAKFFVFDTKNDTTTLKSLLEKPEMQDVDLIVGPLSYEAIEITASWCKKHKVRLVCPVVSKASVLKNNPYVHYAVPSDATLINGLANYTLKTNAKDQLIIIRSNNEKEGVLYNSFRDVFHTPGATHPKLIEATLDNFTTFIKSGVHNVIIFPTNDKLLAVKFMNNLNKVAPKFEKEYISVYGTKEWMNFDEVKPAFKNTFHFHFASPNDLNYTYNQTEKLHYKYRSSYNADMTKMAVQGFDVLFYFCSGFLLDKTPEKMIMNEFEMNQKGITNGYENVHSFILELSDYKLVNASN
jgi:LysM repeat protein